MGELSHGLIRITEKIIQKDVIRGSITSGSSYVKTLTINDLKDAENFVLYACSDRVHTDTPNILSVDKNGNYIYAYVLYYSDGRYMIKSEICTISNGTISSNGYFRKSCLYRYIMW